MTAAESVRHLLRLSESSQLSPAVKAALRRGANRIIAEDKAAQEEQAVIAILRLMQESCRGITASEAKRDAAREAAEEQREAQEKALRLKQHQLGTWEEPC
jgi:hypothetical protein